MNTIETLLEQSWVIVLGWALIHFIWQGALVAALLAVALRVFRGWSTNARYGAACGAMILMLSAPVVTMAILGSARTGETPSGRSPLISTRFEPRAQAIEIEALGLAGALKEADSNEAARRSHKSNWTSGLTSIFAPLLPWMTLVWLFGVSFFALRFACSWGYAQRLRTHGVRQMDSGWGQALQQLCQQLRVPRPVRLLESTVVKVPMAIGWLRPVILLPVGAMTGLSTRQLEAIIAHELAHIRRHDYLINLLQAVIETLLFYHPAVWWVSGRIRQEREHCCDDLAVAVCGDPLAYARALLEMEQLRAAEPQLAVAANGGSLMNRIQRLVIAQPQSTDRFAGDRYAGLLAGAIAIITVVSIGVGAQILKSSAGTVASNDRAQDVSLRRQEINSVNSSSVSGEVNRSAQDDRAIEALLSSLQNSNRDVRKAAVEALAQYDGVRAIDLLIAASQDIDRQVRERAVAALGGREDKRSADALITAMADRDWQVREQAAIALGQLDDARVAEQLQKALLDHEWQVREQAARALGVEGQEQSVKLLSNSLRDQHEQVREAAAKSLGIIGDYRAAEALQKALQDRDGEVRKIVAEALERINQNQNINDSPNENVENPPGAQIGRLGNLKTTVAEGLQALHSSNPEARADGACSLGRLGAVDAIPALINMLGDDAQIQSMKCWDGGNWSPALHALKQSSPGEQAAIALASLGQAAVDPLIAALGYTSSSVRRNAAWAIGELRGGRGTNRSSAVEPLISALNDGDSWVRTAAAFSLGEMRPRQSIESLVVALGDESWRVREMAAYALGEMKSRSAVESLKGLLLRDENGRVRSKVAWALGEIKDSRALDALTVALNDQDQQVRATVRHAISEIQD